VYKCDVCRNFIKRRDRERERERERQSTKSETDSQTWRIDILKSAMLFQKSRMVNFKVSHYLLQWYRCAWMLDTTFHNY